MYKIEQTMFENAIIVDDITQEYIDSLREFSVIYGTYKYRLCYIVTNTYFDSFTNSTTWIQTMIVLTSESDGNRSIDHVKSRYLKPLSTTGDTIWTRWQTEDANTYNYLNGYLKESNKIVLREWEDQEYTETDINFVINTLEDEQHVNLINFTDHQNELFLVPDNSIQLHSCDILPSPAVDYYNMYYIPKQRSSFGNNIFEPNMIYFCDHNTNSDSSTYPYMWKAAVVVTAGGSDTTPDSSFVYDVISEISDIPGIS